MEIQRNQTGISYWLPKYSIYDKKGENIPKINTQAPSSANRGDQNLDTMSRNLEV
jgi:hypothetical protein